MNARTPQLVRLGVALAKAHYYDSPTLEEQITRHARLVEVEAELRDLTAEPEDEWCWIACPHVPSHRHVS